MNNRIPHNCKTCEIPLIGTGGAEACPHFSGNPNAQCPKYQRIGTEWMRLNEDRTFEKFAAWDEKHRERVGRGPASSTLRDLMARDLVRWLDRPMTRPCSSPSSTSSPYAAPTGWQRCSSPPPCVGTSQHGSR